MAETGCQSGKLNVLSSTARARCQTAWPALEVARPAGIATPSCIGSTCPPRRGAARPANVMVAKASVDLEPVAANVGCLAQAGGRALEDDLTVSHHVDAP